MEQFPSPPLPSQQDIIAENQLIRYLLFVGPPLLILALVGVAVLIAIPMALNFNPMNWLE